MGREWIDAWLLRDLLARHPAQADNVLSVTESIAARGDLVGEELPWWGRTAAAVIAWDAERFLADVPLEDRGSTADVDGLEVRVVLPAAEFPDPAGRLASFLRDAHAPVTVTGPAGACGFASGCRPQRLPTPPRGWPGSCGMRTRR